MNDDEAAVAEMVAKDAAVTVKLLMRYRAEWDQDGDGTGEPTTGGRAA